MYDGPASHRERPMWVKASRVELLLTLICCVCKPPPACPLPPGLGPAECDRAADGQREALLQHGALRQGEPAAALLRLSWADPGVRHPLLPGGQGRDLSCSVGFTGQKTVTDRTAHLGLPHGGVHQVFQTDLPNNFCPPASPPCSAGLRHLYKIMWF